MATPRFDGAFGRLVAAFDRYRNAPRSPYEIPELGRRRIVMDVARSEMATVRKSEGYTFADPPTPDWVDPSLGAGSTSRAGILSLVATLLLIAGGSLAFITLARDLRTHDLTIDQDSIVASVGEIDQGCNWRIDFSVENTTDSEVNIEMVDLGGRESYDRLENLGTIEPHGRADLRWELPLTTCPFSPPSAESRALRVTFTTGDETTPRVASLEL